MLNEIKNKLLITEVLSLYMNKLSLLKIIKYSKKSQELFNITIDDYKNISTIIIELIYDKSYSESSLFVNYEQRYKPYFHVFFNDEKKEQEYPTNINLELLDSIKHFVRSKITNKKKEIVKGYTPPNKEIKKIKIVIDYQVTSLRGLFKNCCFKEINFIQFYRKNIVDMSQMFYNTDIDKDKYVFNNFVTVNVTNMSEMFASCEYLKTINLSNFDTRNVTDMGFMFSRCERLKSLDLTMFKTDNLIRMDKMFSECQELEDVNLSSFNTSKVISMSELFAECTKLKNINLKNFNADNLLYTDRKSTRLKSSH